MLILATRISDITAEEILQFGFPILIGMTILALIFYSVTKNKRYAEDEAQPLRKAMAKVVDKQQIPPNAIVFEVWVMFETEYGQRVRVMCKPNHTYIVGDEGCLRWQGSRLLSFERGNITPKTTGSAGARQDYIPAWKRVEMENAQQSGEGDT